MLVSLKFDVNTMNNNTHGVTYSVASELHEGKEVDVYLGCVDNKHNYWSDCQENEVVWGFAVLGVGIYFSNDFNFEHTINDHSDYIVNEGYYGFMKKDGQPVDLDYNADLSTRIAALSNSISTYGAADSVEQVIEHYKEAIDSSNPIVISVIELKKEDQHPEGGWRWHKWGEYIGNQNPQMEYLYDEPIIEKVIVFHVYCVEKKSS